MRITQATLHLSLLTYVAQRVNHDHYTLSECCFDIAEVTMGTEESITIVKFNDSSFLIVNDEKGLITVS